MSDPVEYTNDPALVESVVWYIASERVCDFDQDAEDYVDNPALDDLRWNFAEGRLYQIIKANYPNTYDVFIGNGGFENQFASMSPRANTVDGSIYEPFFDDMTSWEDRAISEAFDKYPTPEPGPDELAIADPAELV